MTENLTHIKNRLHNSMIEPDRLSWKRALHDYIIDNNINVDDLKPNDELAEDLLPRVILSDLNWQGIKNMSDIPDSRFKNSIGTNLKNQFRNKGQTLRKKIAAEKILRQEDIAS